MENYKLCPICHNKILYTLRHTLLQSIRENLKCRQCAGKERIGIKRPPRSEKWKRNISLSRKGRFLGENNPNYGNRGKLNPIYGSNNPAKRPEIRKKISDGVRKSFENPKRRLSNRLARLGQITPNFNPIACQKIDEYGRTFGYKFQHAMNGGEVKVVGYSLDGYDKEKNVVIEYNEKYHNTPIQRKKDELRKQRIIEHLNCKFIELREGSVI